MREAANSTYTGVRAKPEDAGQLRQVLLKDDQRVVIPWPQEACYDETKWNCCGGYTP